jgi:hypothetical protein
VVDLIIGALIMLAGILTGRVLPGRRPKPPELPKPYCGCTHHYSVHDPKKGMACNAAIYDGRTLLGNCACVRYTGPVPLPEYVAPELAEG